MRIKHIDVTKGIAITLMVLGHALGMSESKYSLMLVRYISCFHMPLFFVIYGYVSKPSGGTGFVPLLRKRAKSYLIPYFVWGAIYSSTGIFRKAGLLLYASHQTLEKASTATALWFLPTFFLSAMEYALVCKCLNSDKLSKSNKNRNVFLCLIAVLLATVSYILPPAENGYPWGINIAFIGVFFMIIGRLLKLLLEQLNKNQIWVCISVIPIVLLLSQVNDEVNTSIGVYGKSYILFLTLAVLGSIESILLGMKIAGKASKGFERLGEYSLGILCVHRLSLWAARTVLTKFEIEINMPVALVVGVCTIPLAYFISVAIKKVVPEIV